MLLGSTSLQSNIGTSWEAGKVSFFAMEKDIMARE